MNVLDVPENIRSAFATYKEHEGSRLDVHIGQISELNVERYESAVRVGSSAVGVEGKRRLVPLLYLSSVVGWTGGPAENVLGVDGLEPAIAAALPDTGLRVMGGGQDLVVHRLAQVGDDVVMEVTLSEVILKSGGRQPLILLEVDRRYRDSLGPLIDCRETFIAAQPQ